MSGTAKLRKSKLANLRLPPPLAEIGNTNKWYPMRVLSRSVVILAFGFGIFTVLVGCNPQGLEDYNKGVYYQQAGQIDLAEQQFKIALQKNPELAEAHLNLGLIYLNRGWYDGAEISTKKAVKILERTQRTWVEGSTWQQTLSIAYNNLGAIEIGRGIEVESQFDFATARVRWGRAISFFRKAIELNQSNSLAQANIKRFKNAY